MALRTFETVPIGRYLAGIEALPTAPWSFSDIVAGRSFYPNELSRTLDTSTFILWQRGRKCKVTTVYPWGNIKREYLDDCILGKRSIISPLPSEYGAAAAAEFQIVNPSDDPSAEYVLSLKHTLIRNSFSLDELKELRAGKLGEGLTKEEALQHPLWLALLDGDQEQLENMVDSFSDDNWSYAENPFAMYLEYPGKPAVLTWRALGADKEYGANAASSFDKQKVYVK